MILKTNYERFKDIILEKLVINKNIKINNYKYHPKDRDELEKLVKKLIDERGNEADLNDIDTSDIEDMSKIFYASKFDGDISKWNVSNVTNMRFMFCDTKFSGDISDWDVSNVKDMRDMFNGCSLEKNPPKWYKE